MNEVNIEMDGGAHTVLPIAGGEVWVEHNWANTYEIGVESCEKYRSGDLHWGCLSLTRKELKAFRREIGRVLKDTKGGVM